MRLGRPDVEPASVLLERILAERRARWEEEQLRKYEAKGKKPPKEWREKYKEPIPPRASGLPRLPESWCWATVDQISFFLRNGLSKKPSPTPPGVRILRINAVRPMAVDLDESRYYTDHSVSLEDYLIENDDLLFTRYNGSLDLLGVAGLVRSCDTPTLHPDKLIRVKTVLASPLPEYVEIATNVGVSRKHMLGRARTTAGQTGISGKDVREMPIPLCPVLEQEIIVSEIDQLITLVTELNGGLQTSHIRASRLRQAILKRAFEGGLAQSEIDADSTRPLRGDVVIKSADQTELSFGTS